LKNSSLQTLLQPEENEKRMQGDWHSEMPSEQIETRIRFRVIEKCQRRPSTFFSLKLSV
jgi:hypothetical protein